MKDQSITCDAEEVKPFCITSTWETSKLRDDIDFLHAEGGVDVVTKINALGINDTAIAFSKFDSFVDGYPQL